MTVRTLRLDNFVTFFVSTPYVSGSVSRPMCRHGHEMAAVWPLKPLPQSASMYYCTYALLGLHGTDLFWGPD